MQPRGAPSRTAVFIDGRTGTVGLSLRERLSELSEFSLIEIPDDSRYDADARLDAMRRSDVAVLCLPDSSAREAVAMATELGNDSPKLLDASTAHRVAAGWTYGLPELTPSQPDEIAAARLVSNPGCYAVGANLLLRPLRDSEVLPSQFPVVICGISGYTGGGKAAVAEHEKGTAAPLELYGLGLDHKHVPEIHEHSRLDRRPLFTPAVANFPRGMMVWIPIHLDVVPGQPSAREFLTVLQNRYAAMDLVRVSAIDDGNIDRLAPADAANDDHVYLYVIGARHARHLVLAAKLDNLGKGAAGTAIQNIRLMASRRVDGRSVA